MRPLLPITLVLASLAGCQDSDVSRAVGARCEVSSECEDVCLAPSSDWPGGFCTLTCDTDDGCPADAACIADGNTGVCAFTCVDAAGCEFLGAGYQCTERDGRATGAPTVMVCRG